jgi:L-asparaginase
MREAGHGSLDMLKKQEAIDLLLSLEPKLHATTRIDVNYIDNIDSTNFGPEHWDKIGKVIRSNYHKYDGFVITHGTNTMAYTASALSWSLQNLGKPVVLTGSQIPGYKVESDARRNFVNAVRIAKADISGVLVVFDEEIILGARSSKVSESRLDAFETINWDLLGEIRFDVRLSSESRPRANRRLKLINGFESDVSVVTLVPGTTPEMLRSILRGGTKGLILRGYGPGDIAYRYLPVLKEAQKMRVPVVVTTQCIEGSTLMHINDVGREALDAGVIQSHDMTIESTSTKLMWTIKHYPYKEIRKIMHTNFVGEINIEGKYKSVRISA